MRKDTKLSANFTYREFLVSQEATRRVIKNIPSNNDIENLYKLATTLEEIRSLVGNNPIVITSGFRSSELNRAIGGSRHSAHIDGRAADIICPKFGSPKKLFNTIKNSSVKFDQIIDEYEDWVHFAIAKRNRKQILTARIVGGETQYNKIT